MSALWAPGLWDPDLWADGLWEDDGPPPSPPVAARVRQGTHFRGPLLPGAYTTLTVPEAIIHYGAMLFVLDGDAGAPCLAVSDGTSWRRITLGEPLVPPVPGDELWATDMWASTLWANNLWQE